MKGFILCLLVATAFAGVGFRGSRLPLEAGRRNVLEFVCGVTDAMTPKISKDSYNYRFVGLPRWV